MPRWPPRRGRPAAASYQAAPAALPSAQTPSVTASWSCTCLIHSLNCTLQY
jgi:hypothetical protein